MSTTLIVAVLAVFCLFAISMGSEGPWKRDGEGNWEVNTSLGSGKTCSIEETEDTIQTTLQDCKSTAEGNGHRYIYFTEASDSEDNLSWCHIYSSCTGTTTPQITTGTNYEYLDHYEVAQGACRNQDDQVEDIFAHEGASLTLAQCKSKCSSTSGCNAVSYKEAVGACLGTSMKAYTTSESDWKCYFKNAVDCAWGEYGEWSTCSATCGGGTRTRTRDEATAASNGGDACPGSNTDTEDCSTDACPDSESEDPKTFGVCTSPVWNKWQCGKAIGNWKYSRLQRYSHPGQGDVCFSNKWPKLRTWRCPKDCDKVAGPPFCKNREDGDACRVPIPGGGSSEEAGGSVPY